jgi:zinc protease
MLLFALAAATGLLAAPAEEGSDQGVSSIRKATLNLRRFTLQNGAVCLLKEDHSAPAVSLQVWIGTGSIHEGEHLGYGMSHAVEHMIFKGTEKRKPGDIAKEIAEAGGNINAYTSFDRTVFHTDLPSRNWETGLEVLADALMNASFPKKEWAKEKNVILREIAMGKDSPGRVINKLLWKTAYTTHPYKYPVIGYRNLFARLSREELRAFFRNNYVSENAIVVAVGDFDADVMEKKIRSTLGRWKHKVLAPRYIPAEPDQMGARSARETGSYEVSRLEWVYHTVALDHPDAVALDVLAQIVGRGRSSRLNARLKEDLQLVQSISAWSYTPKDPGLFGISATFSPDQEEELLDAIDEEISTWLNEGFSEKEVARARNSALRSELSELESMKGQASSYAAGEFYAANPAFSVTYLRRLNSVTVEELTRVAKKYFRDSNRTTAILSPEEEAQETKQQPQAEEYRKPVKMSLSNGMPLIVREDRSLPFVYFCVAARGGLLAETEADNGITKLMADLLTRGTKDHSSSEIAEMIESRGASLTPFSGQNSFGLKGKCFTRDAELLLELASDCLLNPTFPSEELEKLRKLQIAELEKIKERPFSIAKKELRKMIFAGHPYRWTTLGTRESLSQISPQALEKHRKRLVKAGNMAVAIFGDVSKTQAETMAEKYFANVPDTGAPDLEPSRPQPDLPSKNVKYVPKEQAVILMGLPAIPIDDPRIEPFTLVQKSLNGMSSRLFRTVRDKRGLAYYVGAFNQIGIDTGALIFYAGTEKEKVEDVRKLFIEEIERITGKGLDDEEIRRSRNRVISNYEMGLQNNLDVAMKCTVNEILGLGYAHMFSTEERYQAVTPEQIHEAARSVLNKEKTATSLVLPENKK